MANRTYVPLVVAGGFGRTCIGFDAVFWVALLSKRLVDSYHWMWLMLVGVPMLCFVAVSFYLDF